MGRLVVVSNRIATPNDKKASAGGLAVGILGALKASGGTWFGWSGEIGDDSQPLKKVSKGDISWASFNLSEEDHELYYNQFSNAVLWPAFHYRLDLVNFQRPAWEGYLRVNAAVAQKLLPLLADDDMIWVHDYHLLPFASELRKNGVKNRIGFFLHIPFPTPEIFNALPPHAELLEQLCDYDLLGFQTENDRQAFVDCVAQQTTLCEVGHQQYRARGKTFRTAVYPISIEPQEVARSASGPLPPKLAQLKAELKGVKNIFSVERWITQGAAGAFSGLRGAAGKLPPASWKNSLYPDSAHFSGRCSGVSGYPPSTGNGRRANQRPLWSTGVDAAVLFESALRSQTTHEGISLFGRGLVTPLRDGMNLVAKEFVAAQDPENRGCWCYRSSLARLMN